MKAYERFLKSIADFFSSEGFWVLAFIVFLVVIAVWDERSINTEIETEQVAWCLDNGGRTVEIDGITDCFELVKVNLLPEDCGTDPSHVFMSPPGATNFGCYQFKRLAR